MSKMTDKERALYWWTGEECEFEEWWKYYSYTDLRYIPIEDDDNV